MSRFIRPRIRPPASKLPDGASPDTLSASERGQDLARQLQSSYGNGAVTALLEDDHSHNELPSSPFRDLLRRGEEPPPVMELPAGPAPEPAKDQKTGESTTAETTDDQDKKGLEPYGAKKTGEAAEDGEKPGQQAKEGEGGEAKEKQDEAKEGKGEKKGKPKGKGDGDGGEAAAPVDGGSPESDSDPLGAWKAKVSVATHSVKPPKVDAAPHVSTVSVGGAAIVGKQAPKREAVDKSAKDALPPVPKGDLPPPVPPEPDPVPSATKLVIDASNKRLPDQTLPKLETSPSGEIPTIGNIGSLSAKEGFEAPPPPPAPEEAKADGKTQPTGKAGKVADSKDPNQKNAAAIHQKNEKLPELAAKPKTGDAITLTDTGPPPAPTFTGTQKTNMAKVLARISENPDKEVDDMLNMARGSAYPGGILNTVYPDIGVEKKGVLTAELTAELERVRKESGISEQELTNEIAHRKTELEAEKNGATAQVEDASKTQKEGLKKEGEETSGVVKGTAEALHKKVETTVEASGGANDPQLINLKRDRLIGDVTKKVADQTTNYKRAKDTRHKALDQAAAPHVAAYRDTAEREAREMVNKATDENKTSAIVEAAKRRGWAIVQIGTLNKKVLDFKEAATTASDNLTSGITTAGFDAREQIRTWAEEKTGEGRSWWQWFLDMFSDWSKLAEANAEAWETATAQEARDAIAGDFTELDNLIKMAREGVDLAAMAKNGQLNEQQMGILVAFFSQEGKQNPIAAVTMTLRARIQRRWMPKLTEGFEKELMDKEDSEWKNLEAIGATQRGGFNASTIGISLYEAMHGGLTGWGTDEEKIFNSLAGLTKLQGAAVRKYYRTRYSKDLDKDLDSELGGHEYKRAMAQISGDSAKADAAALREAMHGGLTGLGTDETAIHNVLRGKSEVERRAIMAEYQKEYHISLEADLHSEMDEGDDRKRADAYLQGNTQLGDAVALHDAMKGSFFFGLGTDEKGIEKVYTDIRAEVAAQAQREGWSTARMEAEIRRRNGEVEQSFNTEYGSEYKDAGSEGALRAAFKSELSEGELELANALADADETRADAARIRVEMQSFVTDDDAVNAILHKQYDRALEDLKRDKWPAIDYDLKQRAAKAKPPWTPEDWERERRLATRDLEREAQKASAGYMKNMEKAYDAKAWGSGALRLAIAFNTSGMDQNQAYTLLDQGYLTDVQKIDFSIQGLGTNEAMLEKTLKGKTAAEIQVIREAWEKQHPNEKFNDRILEETGIWGYRGGREKFDTQLLLEGEPVTLQEKLAREQKRIQYELDTETPDGHALAGAERNAMLAELKDLEEAYNKLSDPKTTADQKALLYGQFERRQEGVQAGVSAYRTQVDALADTASNIAGAVVAVALVVAGIVGGVFTGGAATVAMFALLTSLAATAASMAAKAAIKGSNYSADEIAVDVAVGVVDAAVSVATAGIGSKLLAMKGLAQFATKGRAAQFVAKMISEGVENMIQSAAPTLARNVLNDKIWESTNSFGEFAEGSLMETVTGTAMGMGMGKVMEFGMGKLAKALKPGELTPDMVSGDILAKRGKPEQRLALFHEFKAANPDATMSEFLKQLDAGVLKQANLDDAMHKLQREMRTELLSGIPPELRGTFADTPIKVMSDADFAHFTKSSTGNAAVLIEGGKLTVVIREGAPLSVLREEGVHLRQSLDPKTKAKMTELDESRLARWDELPLDEQLQTYKTKIEVEVEGQQLLIQNLRESMEKADAAALKGLSQQLEQAEKTLKNLNARAAEVDGITPDMRAKLANGTEPKPQYLEQPPRLFGKKDVALENLEIALAGDPAALAQAKETLDKIRSNPSFKDSEKVNKVLTEITGAVDRLKTKPVELASFMDSVDNLLKKKAPDVQGLLIAASQAPNPAAFAKQATDLAATVRPSQLKLISDQVGNLPPGQAGDVMDVFGKLNKLPKDFPPSDVLPLMKEMRELAKNHHLAAGELEFILRRGAADLSPATAAEMHGMLDMIEKFPEKWTFDDPPPLPEGHEYIYTEEGLDIRRRPNSKAPAKEIGPDGNFIDRVTKRVTYLERIAKWDKELPQLDQAKQPNLKGKVDTLPKPPAPNGFTSQDLAIVRRWGDMIEKVHGRLGDVEGAKFLDDLFKGLQPPVTERQYDTFRGSVREKMVTSAVWEKPPDALTGLGGKARPVDKQWEIVQDLLKTQPDPASKGELLSTFREARLKQNLGIEGGVTGLKVAPETGRKIDGSGRMVDGLLDVTGKITIGAQTLDTPEYSLEPGKYAAEDKAGEGAFKLDQAEAYSRDLRRPGGMSVDGTSVKGIVYTFDSLAFADAAVAEMDHALLDGRIFVAYYDTKGKLQFLPRNAPPIPAVSPQ